VLNAFILAIALACQAHAQTAINTGTASSAKPAEIEVTVTADPAENPATGRYVLTAGQIETRPMANSNLTDLLRSHPVVQFSNHSQNSLTQGEIKPDAISMHGSRPYQGLFNIDGVRMNNDLDPVDPGNGVTLAYGTSSEQGFYLDSRLIESLAVYDSNISARYSGFTGGVVEAGSRSWKGGQGGRIFFRHTDSDWNETITDDRLEFDSANNDRSNPARFQPDYKKSDYGAWAETGLAKNLGIVVSASRRDSKIPMLYLGGANYDIEGEDLVEIDTPTGYRSQRRQSDNLSAKLSWYPTAETTLHWTMLYSGYEEDMFMNGSANSGYHNEHDGLGGILNLEQATRLGKLEITASYRDMKDARDSDTNYQVQVLDYTDWENQKSFVSGGPGSLDSRQKNAELDAVFTFDRFQTGAIGHRMLAGAGLNQVKADFTRDETHYAPTFIISGGYVMPYQADAFFAGSEDARYASYHVFAEDAMKWKRLTLRLGLRMDRDDFIDRNNLAPRTSLSLDVFGDERSVVTVGANRYYGSSMLTYALYGAQNNGLNHVYYGFTLPLDSPDNDWTATHDYEGLDRLKTPYSDELMVALNQRWRNSQWFLQYVHRAHRDEVRSRPKYDADPGTDYEFWRSIREFTNDSQTDSDNVFLSVRNIKPVIWRGIGNTFGASVAWQETKSDTALELGYSELDLTLNVDPRYAWCNGSVIDAKDLPATDFNAPWKVNLDWQAEWKKAGLSMFNRVTWKSSRDQVYKHNSGTDDFYPLPDGQRARKYSTARIGSLWRWDVTLQWQPAFARDLGFSAEVSNVFNRKNQAGVMTWNDTACKVYQPGRQVWLGVFFDF
jgi:hypothetical protein